MNHIKNCKVLFFSFQNYKPYNKLENTDNTIVVYKSIFEKAIEYNKKENFDCRG